MKSRPSARHAFVKAEVATALAHQIKAIRLQRGLTQAALAKMMGTTQAAVSRLEDPSYGRISLQTLFDLACAFDTGLQVRFMSTVQMLRDTWTPSFEAMKVRSFEDEAPHVGFVEKRPQAVGTPVMVESSTALSITLPTVPRPRPLQSAVMAAH